ncbi:MAG: flagellar hook-length control protein FliK [Campylobacterota bacterium]|nr:flagellar hook-length control protein FliK [Campylobacterota bacterium]
MNINSSTILNLFSSKLQNIVKEKLDTISNNGKVDIDVLLKDKDIQKILNSLFSDISNQLKSKNKVENILSNNKDIFNIKSINNDLNNLSKVLNNDTKFETQNSIIKEFLTNIKDTSSDGLKNNFINSGIFLESKIASNSEFKNDIKTVLLQLQETLDTKQTIEPQKEMKVLVDKLIQQIEFYQLYSYTSNSSIIYFPFLWNSLDSGELKFKQDDKNSFSCIVDLSLKNYGEIRSLIQLNNSNISINIAVENSELKYKIQKSLSNFRSSIYEFGLIITELNVFDLLTEDKKTEQEKTYDDNSYGLNFGIDIKA